MRSWPFLANCVAPGLPVHDGASSAARAAGADSSQAAAAAAASVLMRRNVMDPPCGTDREAARARGRMRRARSPDVQQTPYPTRCAGTTDAMREATDAVVA